MQETTREAQASSRIEYWREQVAQHERSGQTVKQFCQAQGITEQSFYVWRKRLQKQSRVRFALVETTPGEQQLAGEAGLELMLASGERLRIGSSVDPAWLRTVLAVLRG